MSRIRTFKSRMLAQDPLAGTFLKTPHYVLVEVLASSGLPMMII